MSVPPAKNGMYSAVDIEIADPINRPENPKDRTGSPSTTLTFLFENITAFSGNGAPHC
jgi:hypothetical protein